MRHMAYIIGRVGYWLAWPAHYVYLRRSTRTRILLVHGSRVLVVRNWLSDGKWGLPGGGVHRGEPLVQAALRELQEEVGITVSPQALRHAGRGIYRDHGLHFAYHRFVVFAEQETIPKLQWYEIAAASWLDYHELTLQNAQPDLLATLQAWLA